MKLPMMPSDDGAQEADLVRPRYEQASQVAGDYADDKQIDDETEHGPSFQEGERCPCTPRGEGS